LHHGVKRSVLWGAACVTHLLPLVEILLDAGANVNDGVTLPLAASGADFLLLELLLKHGADVNFPWATDGASPLYSILQWNQTPEGPRWLLEHGANPDPVFAGNGETPLHVVARKWDVAMAEQLVSRGADIARRRNDGRSPYAIAELNGNRGVAEWLLARGAPAELSDIDQLVAACSRGDKASADAMLVNRPELHSEIKADHYIAFYQAAERNDVKALETMLGCGFDPNAGDEEMGKTALHCAAMAAWPEATRVLLAHGASVSVCDREFRAQPLIWAAEGSRHARGPGRDHTAVARMLLAAGSPTDWKQNAEPSEPIMEIVQEWCRQT
jgi:ankyrin repeat protein